MEEFIAKMEPTCSIPEIGFGRGKLYRIISYHIVKIVTGSLNSMHCERQTYFLLLKEKRVFYRWYQESCITVVPRKE